MSSAPRGMQETLNRAVVGGLYEALYGQIVDGQAERLPDLIPDLIYCALVPHLAHARALAAIDAEAAAIAADAQATTTGVAPS